MDNILERPLSAATLDCNRFGSAYIINWQLSVNQMEKHPVLCIFPSKFNSSPLYCGGDRNLRDRWLKTRGDKNQTIFVDNFGECICIYAHITLSLPPSLTQRLLLLDFHLCRLTSPSNATCWLVNDDWWLLCGGLGKIWGQSCSSCILWKSSIQYNPSLYSGQASDARIACLPSSGHKL